MNCPDCSKPAWQSITNPGIKVEATIVEMRNVGYFYAAPIPHDDEPGDRITLYQCPSCKRIEISED